MKKQSGRPTLVKLLPHQTTGRLSQGSLFVLLMSLLSSCAIAPPAIPPSPESGKLWQKRMLVLTDVEYWLLKGRIAIKSSSDSMSATIQWTQYPQRSDINFSNLFGQRIAQLLVDRDKAILSMRDKRILAADDASRLLEKYFGWTMPVEGLRYWVLGLPEPESGKRILLDDSGRLKWLEQSGWHIEYRRYAETSGLDLPEKIELTREGLRVRLIIDSWEVETRLGASK